MSGRAELLAARFGRVGPNCYHRPLSRRGEIPRKWLWRELPRAASVISRVQQRCPPAFGFADTATAPKERLKRMASLVQQLEALQLLHLLAVVLHSIFRAPSDGLL